MSEKYGRDIMSADVFTERTLIILKEMGIQAEAYSERHDLKEHSRIRVSIPEEEYTMLLLQSG